LNLRAHEKPVSVDATARVIEMLAGEGLADDDAVSRAREWLIETQQPDGSWESALRGTAAAIPALAAAGEKPASIPVQRSRRWLLSRQNPDGGWGGEPVASDRSDGSEVWRDSTAQHTAWALLTLLAAGERGASVCRGAAWLTAAQRADGNWDAPPGAAPNGDIGNPERRLGPNLPTLALGRTVRATDQRRLDTDC
jgi:squalene-hopene/tetraprenyl-beta-curcumene cyclase